MNQTSVQSNVIETNTNESQALVAKRSDEAIIELNASQLMLVGGGTAIGLLG